MEVQPERETQLREYGNTVADFLLFMRPEAHSTIIQLDKAEREKVIGKATEGLEPTNPSHYYIRLTRRRTKQVLCSRMFVWLAASAGLLVFISFWKSFAYSLSRLVMLFISRVVMFIIFS